jgi:hypothetical protein
MTALIDFFVMMTIVRWRREYAEERQFPEYIDLGGES